MGSIERGLDIVLVRTRDLAERMAGDRRDVFEVFAVDRFDPAAADEIAVARFEWNLHGEILLLELGHGCFLRV